MDALNDMIQGLGFDPFFTGLVVGVVLTLLAKKSHSASQPVRKEAVPFDPAQLDSGVMAEVERLNRQGQKIAAIKLLRDATGMDLRAAKEAVEALPNQEI
jgi:ribosomal protein L7/L12